jgi:hypothetical protein
METAIRTIAPMTTIPALTVSAVPDPNALANGPSTTSAIAPPSNPIPTARVLDIIRNLDQALVGIHRAMMRRGRARASDRVRQRLLAERDQMTRQPRAPR